jgi:hypothetical protein
LEIGLARFAGEALAVCRDRFQQKSQENLRRRLATGPCVNSNDVDRFIASINP